MSSTLYEVQKAQTDTEVLKCFHLLKLLRPHIEEEKFIETIRIQEKEGYQLLQISDQEGVKSVAGYRIAHFLAWGKVLYVDDLVTLPEARGIGFGTHLIKWLMKEAKETRCAQIHLDTKIQRQEAHRLYLNLGMNIDSLHLSMDL